MEFGGDIDDLFLSMLYSTDQLIPPLSNSNFCEDPFFGMLYSSDESILPSSNSNSCDDAFFEMLYSSDKSISPTMTPSTSSRSATGGSTNIIPSRNSSPPHPAPNRSCKLKTHSKDLEQIMKDDISEILQKHFVSMISKIKL